MVARLTLGIIGIIGYGGRPDLFVKLVGLLA